MSGNAWHTVQSVVLAACWGGFGVVWIGGALYNAARGPEVRERSGRGFAWLVAIAALWLLSGRSDAIDWQSLTLSSPWIRAIGVVLLLTSTGFTLWARMALGTMWSASVVAKAEHELRTDGPYALTRHPIYTGLVGMLIGTALVNDLGRSASVCVLVVVYLVLKAHAEERLLGGIFPEYAGYRRRVPRLVPGARRLAELLHR